MKNKKAFFIKRILAVVTAVALIFTLMIMPNASAKTLEELKEDYKKAEAQIAENEKKLKDIKNQKLANEEKLKVLSQQAENISGQLKIIESQMQIINADIEKFSLDIKKLDVEIDSTKDKIKSVNDDVDITNKHIAQRISASYMAGSTSWIEMLLEADSLSNLLLRMQLVASINRKDKELVDHLVKDLKKLEKLEKNLFNDKKKLEDKKKRVVERKNDLDKQAVALAKKQNAFNDNYLKISNLMDTLDKNSEAYKAEIKKQQSKRDAFALEIDKIMQSGSQSGDGSHDNYYNDGKMMWPVPYKNSYISAGYGYYDPDNDGNLTFHPAIDIVVRENGRNVSYGKKIVAAQSGRVIKRGYSDVGGNYVTIDHGDGFRTYYGHCSRVHVSAGMIVEKGQHIADIGDTGYVTGPHVHFQVMQVVNGQVQRLNPLNFVTPPKH